MAFNLIGLGMDLGSISVGAFGALKKCDEIYLENYTVDFPYDFDSLKKALEIDFVSLVREKVEDESVLENAKEKEVALLVYGDCLSATTHLQLIGSCREKGIGFRVFHNASILNVVSDTGLSLYKFGKTASMPSWKEHTNKPTSFVDYVKNNLTSGAHTLILTDIGLSLGDAISQLKESFVKEDLVYDEKMICASRAGNMDSKIFYGKADELEKLKVDMPFCLIVPSGLSHFEEDFLKGFSAS
jgi:diphthine synthase